MVSVFVEITPFDLVKYEVDKHTGYLRVDRAQKTSSLPPAIYGFIPQTLAGGEVATMMPEARRGDLDPLDICVLAERPINRAEVLLQARVIGGVPMLDHGEADDKIVAVMLHDPVYGGFSDIEEVPAVLTDRLVHYFSTYKLTRPDDGGVRVGDPYRRAHAEAVVSAAIRDYQAAFTGEQDLSPVPPTPADRPPATPRTV